MQKEIQIQYPLTRPDRPTKNNFSGIIALTLVTLTGGTAGAYQDPFALEKRIASLREPVGIKPRIDDRAAVQAAFAHSTGELLLKIRDVFGLRMSELAQVFGVSRRAAYDWLEGATPKPDSIAKIYRLSKQADVLREAGIKSIDHFIHRPVIAERSLLDLLKSGQSIESAISIIKTTAAQEAQNRKSLGRRTSETNTKDVNGFDEVSTPIFD